MDIFSIPQPPYKELAFIEHELDLLSKMWGVVAEWEATYGAWKNGHFKELKVGWRHQQGQSVWRGLASEAAAMLPVAVDWQTHNNSTANPPCCKLDCRWMRWRRQLRVSTSRSPSWAVM